MAIPDALDRGRAAFAQREWTAAHDLLTAADRVEPLGAADLDRLAVAAYLIGRDDESVDGWARAFRASVHSGDVAEAARHGFWAGFTLLLRGRTAQAGGWLARASRLVEDGDHDCVARGLLLVPVGLDRMEEGDAAGAHRAFEQASGIGMRFGDPDLVALGTIGRGQALLRMEQTAAGVALLDEVMVAVTADEVSALVSGIAYCAVIEEYQGIFDVRRAQEWTDALARWCASQPDLVPYRGQCMVDRAEIMQLRGAWPEAMDEALRAIAQLSRPTAHPAVGTAFYQQAELHRLRGEFAQAEEAYRNANGWGRVPQPGLALLRLAQGDVRTAFTAIRRAVDETVDRVARSQLLPAFVEIAVAAGDVADARSAADELAGIADDLDVPFVRAVSAHVTAAVLLAEGDARGAGAALRDAIDTWRQLEAPYEMARARALLAVACRELGDDDGAAMEQEIARAEFERLGAQPDVARTESAPAGHDAGRGLTERELQVLALTATGRTNRQIAAELFISEHTVRRHLENIFAKLGVSSRAAATAYAYQHDLI